MTDEELSMPSFAVYSGKVEPAVREMIRNIYNGNFENIPTKITEKLKSTKGLDNLHGKIIQLFMISESGAEGLDLKNIRKVHLLEPHWNPARIDQVIGRAVRIDSHKILHLVERTVDAYLYIISLTDSQKAMTHVISEHSSTDEILYSITEKKRRINESIFKTIKETAVDCNFHHKTHKDEKLKCFELPNPKPNRQMYEADYKEQHDEQTDRLNIQQKVYKKFKDTNYYHIEGDDTLYTKQDGKMVPTKRKKTDL
jgi:predicted transposase YbfD/YdcC